MYTYSYLHVHTHIHRFATCLYLRATLFDVYVSYAYSQYCATLMYIYTYTHIYKYSHVCIHIHIYTYKHTYTVWRRVCICVQHFLMYMYHTHTRNIVRRWYTQKNTCIYVHANMFCIYVHASMFLISIYVNAYIRAYMISRAYLQYCVMSRSLWWYYGTYVGTFFSTASKWRLFVHASANIFWCMHVCVCSYAYCMM